MDIAKHAQSIILDAALVVLDFQDQAHQIARAAALISECVTNGGKVLTCGNGGSSADASHFAAELMGRYKKNRQAWPAVCLSSDAATMTCIANDYGYLEVFARQVNALGRPGDVLVVFTTSGMSQNVVDAVCVAQSVGVRVIAMTGKNGGAVAEVLRDTDIEIRVPSDDTPQIQEAHTLAMHIICDILDGGN